MRRNEGHSTHVLWSSTLNTEASPFSFPIARLSYQHIETTPPDVGELISNCRHRYVRLAILVVSYGVSSPNVAL
jgi:hypothetical protein